MLRYFHTAAVGLPEEMFAQFTATPPFAQVLPMAPTLIYDALCTGGDESPLPVAMLAGIETPVLAVCSSGTQLAWLHATAALVARALPHGTVREVAGAFHDVPADALAPLLAAHFRDAL
ncbi:MAG: hypothetical protein V9G19_14255 [Tetrasphaera sp.]